MNLIKELRKAYPRQGFALHDDGVTVTMRGGHKYLMTIEEAERFLNDLKAHLEECAKRKER